ncbi:MAG: glycerol-3-phosphate acyltransferase [Anaerolineales bacterium]|nr:glycerol-3-phosphate acyltransferase [Anaerolineales bacterium]
MNILTWTLLAFLCGSLPFSLWVGKLALRTDIRQYGDGNPGMTNVVRAGGRAWGLVAMLLDGFKGAIPVGLAYWLSGLGGPGMALIAIAPILGHAFSPLLKFRGGKAVAVTFGVWTGLTLFQGPILLGITLGLTVAVSPSPGWQLFPGMTVVLLTLLLGAAPGWMLAVWGVNLLVFLWKHRRELRRPPRLQPGLRRLFRLP